MPKPHRLPLTNYSGRVRVFFTCLTQNRHRAFEDATVCEFIISDLFAKCDQQRCEVLAYCLMPDHAHLLLAGTSRESQLLTAMTQWKQATGYWYARRAERRLWTKNYWDYVLREPDEAYRIANYIVSDPIRSGLVSRLDEYRWWRCKWSIDECALATANPPALAGGHEL